MDLLAALDDAVKRAREARCEWSTPGPRPAAPGEVLPGAWFALSGSEQSALLQVHYAACAMSVVAARAMPAVIRAGFVTEDRGQWVLTERGETIVAQRP